MPDVPGYSRNANYIFFGVYFLVLVLAFYFIEFHKGYCHDPSLTNELLCYEGKSYDRAIEVVLMPTICDEEAAKRTIESLKEVGIGFKLHDIFNELICVRMNIVDMFHYDDDGNRSFIAMVYGCFKEREFPYSVHGKGIMDEEYSYKCYASLCNQYRPFGGDADMHFWDKQNETNLEEEYELKLKRFLFQRPFRQHAPKIGHTYYHLDDFSVHEEKYKDQLKPKT